MTINSNPQLNDADLELLSAYIDHQLGDGERAALERRLGQEPALRGALDELRATVALLHDLCDIMLNGSLCGLGGLIPYPVLSALRHFPQDFGISMSSS